MKNNSTPSIENRLKKYSALAGSIVAATGAANAQIVYTDVNPDSVVDQVDSVYMLDLNNGKALKTLNYHTDWVRSLAFHPYKDR